MERYEELRRRAVEARSGAVWGLTLFLGKGMAAWLEAWTFCPEVLGRGGAAPDVTAERPIDSKSADLVCVLANMALSGLWEKGA